MGQYKLHIGFEWIIGICVHYRNEPDNKSIVILIPFLRIFIGLNEGSSGVEIFGKYFY